MSQRSSSTSNAPTDVLDLPGVRPLSARSIVASTLLGWRPPHLPARTLVRMGDLFGIPEGTIRVALSRMVADGDLEADEGVYRLTARLVGRQARQEESRHPTVRRWTGGWSTAVVIAQGRPPGARADLRSAMAALRMAELREGVWLRPDNLDTAREQSARAVVDDQCEHFASRRRDGTDLDLAERLWDIGAWQAAAGRLGAAISSAGRDLEVGDDSALAAGFVLSAAVLRHLLDDPLLPDELLPDGWPGRDLRRQYDAYDTRFRRALRDWSNRHH